MNQGLVCQPTVVSTSLSINSLTKELVTKINQQTLRERVN